MGTARNTRYGADALEEGKAAQLEDRSPNMVESLAVLIGCGYPEVGVDGTPGEVKDHCYVGGERMWQRLKSGSGLTLLDAPEAFAALARGHFPYTRLVGIAQAHEPLAQLRTAPSLTTLSVGALSTLTHNPKGFFCLSTGACLDNAVIESFWATLKKELVYPSGSFNTRDEARLAVFEYIEVFYNRERLHSSLLYRTPEGFEFTQQPQPKPLLQVAA